MSESGQGSSRDASRWKGVRGWPRWRVAWDFVLDNFELFLTICSSGLTFATVAFQPAGFWKIVLAVAAAVLAIIAVVLKRQHGDRIKHLKIQSDIANEARDDAAQALDSYHAQTKIALAQHIQVVYNKVGCGDTERISMFMVGDRSDDPVVLLVARHSRNSSLNERRGEPYKNEGAIKKALVSGFYQNRLFPVPLGTRGSNRGKITDGYLTAVMREFGLPEERVRSSRMLPRLYASWRLEGSDPTSRIVVVFESTEDKTGCVGRIGDMLNDPESDIVRVVAATVRDRELKISSIGESAIEGPA